MTDALATVPAVKKQASTETRSWALTVTPLLVGGETPSNPIVTLKDLATMTAYTAGLSGAPSLVGNVITQTVTALVAGHSYHLIFTFTASVGNIFSPALLLECDR